MSRAKIYATIIKYLEKCADYPTPEAYLADAHGRTIARGIEYDPVKIQEMHAELCKIAEFVLYYRRLAMAFGPDALTMHLGAPSMLSSYPTNVGDGASTEEIFEDDEYRVSLVISENEEQIERIWELFSTKVGVMMSEPVEENRSRLVSELETLGVKWGICEAKIETVQAWFQSKWE
ncbi:hypothetical protein L873DRAFT_1804558 [Choiromyces venosus 120613-1]|uniref:Uncharacterized protein n=1 Tax=Choiromyces venosus 120613-1 TaxID=1336337 RepID=A0A3N4JXF0_9PEZI|nr:hypothetical protein L873DRAFT_1804558 [Choiromyces venosus 120613-1]